MTVFNARQVATQKSGFLFDVSLREPPLQPESADGGADLHHGKVLFDAGRVYSRGSNQSSIDLIVNMRDARMQAQSSPAFNDRGNLKTIFGEN